MAQRMDAETEQLEKSILGAHEREDRHELAALYEKAAELKARDGEPNAAAFLYTQAYVFALESGYGRVDAIREILVSLGREAPDAGSVS